MPAQHNPNSRDIPAPPEIQALQGQLDTAEQDAENVVAGLTEELGAWRPDDRSWSVAQCLDHLALTNAAYLQAMQNAADHARQQARFRRRPAVPGLIGRLVTRKMEPPIERSMRMKAPASIQPSQSPSLTSALEAFTRSQAYVRAFLARESDLDLASIKFPNPFVRGFRFTLATGLHIVTAHERRHLSQAWAVRRRAEDRVSHP
jgi:uncharacterized damage-inducible protein DinB